MTVLTLVIFLPLAAALALLAVPRPGHRAVLAVWIAATAADLALVAAMWARHGTSGTGRIAFETNARWIPSVGAGYHVGVDGLSLPLLALTALLFAACAVYSLRQTYRIRAFAVLFLFLETVCLGLFAALDLLLFFVFFDLSIVGMYAVILLWGHGDRARSALKFFLYTFLGSLILLLGFIGLYLGADPHTFDMAELIRRPPLEGSPGLAGLTLLAIGTGLAIKTPVVPFHTWLPPAHTDAPAAGSAILAGVMLKMGTYGLVRIAMPMLPDAWRRYAWVPLAVGLLSVLYGALVALAQENLKRLVAYTSVNHMGYIVLALGAAGYASGDAAARRLAVTGAVTQMVSHGLVTGSLFLLCGVLYDRGRSYDLGRYGGLARGAPVFAALTAVAAFASLGLPGLSGFIAEFQIFTGAIGGGSTPAAVAAAVSVLGILITAALFLRVLHRAVLGEPGELTGRVTDVRRPELAAVVPLLALSLAIGVAPRPLLDTIEPVSAAVVALVAR
ncbi:complex I subunit 4 family protein [Actinomadura xylanilytica]|uniref:complex I subunit 4 family protein n=1 Tax=Actinomadura xylanilytica TaxID=887459 RepID=UPI00255A7950|nr:NADH-quinone oxidoreductase subunit M [Actinomadura xylanilytica]MDL4771718.1 NADH-quinone oxidoreductase subunit M [Actinomadura xylanilytica]